MQIDIQVINQPLFDVMFREPEIVSSIDVKDGEVIITLDNGNDNVLGTIPEEITFIFERPYKVRSWKIEKDKLYLTIIFNENSKHNINHRRHSRYQIS